jgi:hypothetical protein
VADLYETNIPYDVDDIKNAVTAEMTAAMDGVHGCVPGPGDEQPREPYNWSHPVLGDDGLPAA